MIPRTEGRCQTPDWKNALAGAFTDPAALLAYLELDPALLPAARAAAARFGLRVPRTYAELIRKGRPDDPLLRQVLPLEEELVANPGFGIDPVGDSQALAVPGLLHKYHGRALILAAGSCGVHCRYCFRRHYPYSEALLTPSRRQGLMSYLRHDTSISEVILSGGDPLVMGDEKLRNLIRALEEIPHLRRLRIHSRMPVVVPQRITPQLVDLFSASRFETVVVIHANHPRELSGEVALGVSGLIRGGCTLLNQSVLLKGVNDSVEILADLSERLFSMKVLPYYLHLLDRVDGAAHFEVSEPRAREIHLQLRNTLPGYLLPELVRERANERAKTRIC